MFFFLLNLQVLSHENILIISPHPVTSFHKIHLLLKSTVCLLLGISSSGAVQKVRVDSTEYMELSSFGLGNIAN